MEDNSTLIKVKSYLSGLSSTVYGIKAVQELYNPVIAYKFNLFNFWYPQENKISEILAFFLDPNETHGQGEVFLKIFIDKLKLDNFNYDITHVHVKCEHGSDEQRRIDILLSFNNDDFGIAIENKLWAPDQENQLFDYSKFLNKKFKNYILLYLTPDGRDPSEKSIEKEQYNIYKNANRIKTIGYTDDIIEIVREWAMMSRAERIRNFLYDLEQYFKQEFLGDTFMNQSEIISEFAQSNVNNIEAAFETYKAFDMIKQQLADKFTQKLAGKLQQAFNDNGWTINITKAFNIEVNYIDWPCKTIAGILDYDRDRVNFGVKTQSKKCRELFGFIKEHNSGSENNNAYWLKLTAPYNSWDNNLEGIKRIYRLDEDALNYMVEGIERLTELINQYLKLHPDFC